jgi:hypothetical protein
MPRYVFHMQVREDQLARLRELNAEYEPALRRASSNLHGLRSVEKFLVGTEYVELIDFDGEFDDFGAGLSADPAVREFLRAVNGCFTTGLREMPSRQMTTIQRLP